MWLEFPYKGWTKPNTWCAACSLYFFNYSKFLLNNEHYSICIFINPIYHSEHKARLKHTSTQPISAHFLWPFSIAMDLLSIECCCHDLSVNLFTNVWHLTFDTTRTISVISKTNEQPFSHNNKTSLVCRVVLLQSIVLIVKANRYGESKMDFFTWLIPV